MLVTPALFNVCMMIAIGSKESFCVALLSNAASSDEIWLDSLEDEDEPPVLLELVELLPEVLELLLELLSDEPKPPP